MINHTLNPTTGTCEWEQRARVLATLVATMRPDVGLHGVVETVLRQVAAVVGTPRTVLVLHDELANVIVRWDYRRGVSPQDDEFAVTEPPIEEFPTYFFETATELSYVGTDPWPRAEIADPPSRLQRVIPFDSLACVDFTGKSNRGRLFLPDVVLDGRTRATVAWLREILPGLARSLSGLARLRRMRRRAERDERARLGRELHDGPIQAFISIRLALETSLRRGESAADTLREVDGLLQDAIEALRAVSDRARAGVLPPTAAIPVLRQLVERFSAETGIAAQFHSDVESLRVSPRTAYELVAIVREALVNVERHSRATAVSVQLSQRDGVCWLRVDDNGRGLKDVTSGSNVPRMGKITPRVIAERVSAIGGILAVGASPAHGARVEVTIPGAERE